MSRPVALFLAGVAAVVALSGCSAGADAYSTNNPDGQADPNGKLVYRTPAPLETDLPYTSPPLVVPLPGPTGGVPGEVPTEAAPASPGEGNG